jgi:hypothetical protein
VTQGTIGVEPREDPRLSIPPPEQRETYCHECLYENPRTRTTCVSCGARLRHPKEFVEVMAAQSMGVSTALFGRVGAVAAIALFAVVAAVVVPAQVQAWPLSFVGIGLVVAIVGRFIGRAIARAANDTSV